jgi:hypothetical protein
MAVSEVASITAERKRIARSRWLAVSRDKDLGSRVGISALFNRPACVASIIWAWIP